MKRLERERRRNRTTMRSLRLLSSKSSRTYEITGRFPTGSRAFGTSCHYKRVEIIKNKKQSKKEKEEQETVMIVEIGTECLAGGKLARKGHK